MAQVIRGEKLADRQSNHGKQRNRDDEIDHRSGLHSGKDREFITSPIYYVNGEPHIGHLYTSTAVDIAKRFNLILGKKVYTSFGVDEHGQKVESSAEKSGIATQEYVDTAYQVFVKLLVEARIESDCFIRTTSEKHKETARYLWKKLEEADMIYQGQYSGWYSKSDEAFYKKDEVNNGISTVTGSAVEWVSEECFFFKLSEMREWLLEYYIENPQAISPKERYNEVIGMLKDNLPDLAISRSRFTWGIPISEGQVMYVWLDALSNYLTALGYPKNTDYGFWWNEVTHIIGKDILKFHAIYWPAFLKVACIKPPKQIIAHGWWKVGDVKMSKSLGNIVDPFGLIKKYGIDTLRYYMFRSTPFGGDGVFSEKELESLYNSELVNEIGNLIQRSITLCWDKFNATIEGRDEVILDKWEEALSKAKIAMENYNITDYIHAIRQATVETNKYIDHKKPWHNPDTKVLGSLCLCIQRLAILYWPIMPDKCEQIASMIGLRVIKVGFSWHEHTPHPILERPKGLFPRII